MIAIVAIVTAIVVNGLELKHLQKQQNLISAYEQAMLRMDSIQKQSTKYYDSILVDYSQKDLGQKIQVFINNYGDNDTTEPQIIIDSSSLDLANKTKIRLDSTYAALVIEKQSHDTTKTALYRTTEQLYLTKGMLDRKTEENAANRKKAAINGKWAAVTTLTTLIQTYIIIKK